MSYKILSINPGSTSTKVALYENETLVFSENIEHTAEELSPYEEVLDQLEFRSEAIQAILKNTV